MRSITSARQLSTAGILQPVVEVVPVVAGAHPVVVGGSIVGLAVGVGRGVVELAGLGGLCQDCRGGTNVCVCAAEMSALGGSRPRLQLLLR